MTKDEVEKNYR